MGFLETKYETLHHFDWLGNLSLVVGGGVDCCTTTGAWGRLRLRIDGLIVNMSGEDDCCVDVII